MTLFDDIYDLALVSFKDWRLDKLYALDLASFNLTMQGFLLKAIPKFTDANVNLYDYDLTLKQFNETLDLDTQVILSNFLVLEWFESQINDARTVNLLLNSTDFKTNSEANNMKEKSNTRDKFREMNERALTNYSLKNVDWSKLISGDYYNL